MGVGSGRLTFPVTVKPFPFIPTLPFQPLSAPDFHPQPSSPARRRQIRVALLNPGIPERLFGSSTSLMLRLGEERVVGEILSKMAQSFDSVLCSLVLPMVSAHRSPRLCPKLLFTVKTVMIYFIFMAYCGLITTNSHLLLCFIVLGQNIVILTLQMCLI